MDGDVRLRDVTNDDLTVFFEQQRDPEASRMAAFPSRDRAAFMAHWAGILGNAALAKRTILFDGRVAGNIVSFEQDGQRQVGYWLGKEYWGMGIATRALSAFLGEVTVRPLYAYVAKHNIASRRVLEKCRFTICGEGAGFADAGGEQVEEYILVLLKEQREGRTDS